MTQWISAPFGVTAAGEAVTCWTGRCGDYTVQVLTYGAALRSFRVPAPEGSRDILLGFDTLGDYEAQDKYMGATVGRVANRIGGASFVLEGHTYPLAANNGPNCLHGGMRGFDRAVWTARLEGEELLLTHHSPDGDEAFPGGLEVEVRYGLDEAGALSITYQARSDRDTLCSLTNHSYFNLAGHGAGTLEGQSICVHADAITVTDGDSTPTGERLAVDGTPFDLRESVPFLEGLAKDHPQLELGKGYDHNFVLHDLPAGPLRTAAEVTGHGLHLTCRTTQPGLQLYTANYLAGERGKEGAVYGPRSAFCLEAQGWPDAIHHSDFPSIVLHRGETYRQCTVYQVEKSR